jgi:hypothetical protein
VTREVVLYTRANCGLCDEAETALRRLAIPLAFTLRPVDIDADAALRSRYNDAVPVIAVGTREVARAPIEPEALEQALRRELAP